MHSRVVVLGKGPPTEHVAQVIHERRGVEVTVAAYAVEAERELEDGGVALVVVDGGKQEGRELLHWMEGRRSEVPVVIAAEEKESEQILGDFPEVVKIFEAKPLSIQVFDELVAFYAE